MAKSGQGSGRAAETKQSSDSSSVKTAGRGTTGPDVSVSGPGMGGIGGIGTSGGIGGEAGTPPAGTGKGSGSKAGQSPGGDQGVGPDGEPGTPDDTAAGAPGTGPSTGNAGDGVKGSGGSGAAPDTLPADIPRDGTGEDQVARQLREAALAEQDPAIRKALWDEYRKVMGMKPQ